MFQIHNSDFSESPCKRLTEKKSSSTFQSIEIDAVLQQLLQLGEDKKVVELIKSMSDAQILQLYDRISAIEHLRMRRLKKIILSEKNCMGRLISLLDLNVISRDQSLRREKYHDSLARISMLKEKIQVRATRIVNAAIMEIPPQMFRYF